LIKFRKLKMIHKYQSEQGCSQTQRMSLFWMLVATLPDVDGTGRMCSITETSSTRGRQQVWKATVEASSTSAASTMASRESVITWSMCWHFDFDCTKKLNSFTLGSRYRYKGRVLLSVHSPSHVISTQWNSSSLQRSGPGPELINSTVYG